MMSVLSYQISYFEILKLNVFSSPEHSKMFADQEEYSDLLFTLVCSERASRRERERMEATVKTYFY